MILSFTFFEFRLLSALIVLRTDGNKIDISRRLLHTFLSILGQILIRRRPIKLDYTEGKIREIDWNCWLVYEDGLRVVFSPNRECYLIRLWQGFYDVTISGTRDIKKTDNRHFTHVNKPKHIYFENQFL